MKPGGSNPLRPLPQRSAEILRSIVDAFIDAGEPVASRTISRRSGSNLSPASIRNIMADLAEEGYLSQPHTSAGRVPTARAFQDYANSIQVSRGVSVEASRLRQEIRNLETVDAR